MLNIVGARCVWSNACRRRVASTLILHERQQCAVNSAYDSLAMKGKTLIVAPTGSGKTVIACSVIERRLTALREEGVTKPQAVFLAHRHVLIGQALATMKRWHPQLTTSIVDATCKDWSGDVVFAMLPTLAVNLDCIPNMDRAIIVFDEAHHARAITYEEVLDQLATSDSSATWTLGVTATPNRGDGLGIGRAFGNIADIITLEENISNGTIVKPIIMSRPLIEEQVAQIKEENLNREKGDKVRLSSVLPNAHAALQHWMEHALDRPTVIFCSRIPHAIHVADKFNNAGIPTVVIGSFMKAEMRQKALDDYSSGAAHVIVNVGILLEGWDSPRTSCVVILRATAYSGTVQQMVGRGLRPAPGKTDCIVLDFGMSLSNYPCLEQKPELSDVEKSEEYEEVEGKVAQVNGDATDDPGTYRADEIVLRQIELAMMRSPTHSQDGRVFPWVPLILGGAMSDMPSPWALPSVSMRGSQPTGVVVPVIRKSGAIKWFAIVKRTQEAPRLLNRGGYASLDLCKKAIEKCILEEHECDKVEERHSWRDQPASDAQIAHLPLVTPIEKLNRHEASAYLAFAFMSRYISKMFPPPTESIVFPVPAYWDLWFTKRPTPDP